jgi:hypothetical protein
MTIFESSIAQDYLEADIKGATDGYDTVARPLGIPKTAGERSRTLGQQVVTEAILHRIDAQVPVSVDEQ